jgi:hypothetical protein
MIEERAKHCYWKTWRGSSMESCHISGGNMESSGQNLLEQKFEWDLRESFFVINGIFPPKERPASHHIKSVPIHWRGKVVGKGRRFGVGGGGGQHYIKLIWCSTLCRRQDETFCISIEVSFQKILNMSVTHAVSSSYSITQQCLPPLRCPVFQRQNEVNTILLQPEIHFKRTTFSLEVKPKKEHRWIDGITSSVLNK